MNLPGAWRAITRKSSFCPFDTLFELLERKPPGRNPRRSDWTISRRNRKNSSSVSTFLLHSHYDKIPAHQRIDTHTLLEQSTISLVDKDVECRTMLFQDIELVVGHMWRKNMSIGLSRTLTNKPNDGRHEIICYVPDSVLAGSNYNQRNAF